MTHKIRGRVVAPNIRPDSSTTTVPLSILENSVYLDMTAEQQVGVLKDAGGTAPIFRKYVAIAHGPNGPPSVYPVSFSAFSKLLRISGALQNATTGDYLPLPYEEESEATPGFPDNISLKLFASSPPGVPDSVQITPTAGSDYSAFSGFVEIIYTKTATA